MANDLKDTRNQGSFSCVQHLKHSPSVGEDSNRQSHWTQAISIACNYYCVIPFINVIKSLKKKNSFLLSMSFHFSFFACYIRNHILLSRVNLFVASLCSIVQTPAWPFSLNSSYLLWLLCPQHFCNYRSCQSFAGLENSGSSNFLLQRSFRSPDCSCSYSIHASWTNLGLRKCTQHSRWGLIEFTFPRRYRTCSFWDSQTLAPAVFMAALLW